MRKRAVYGIITAASLLLFTYLVTVQGFRLPYVSRSSDRFPFASACDHSFNYYSSSSISVLVITRGSTGKICVEYSKQYNFATGYRPSIGFYAHNSTGKFGICNTCSLTNVDSPFRVTISPDTIFKPNIFLNSKIEIVTYTITVPSNMARRVYGASFSGACPWFFPIAVMESGDSPVQAARSVLSSWNPPLTPCPIPVVGVQPLGVSGFEVENV